MRTVTVKYLCKPSPQYNNATQLTQAIFECFDQIYAVAIISFASISRHEERFLLSTRTEQFVTQANHKKNK